MKGRQQEGIPFPEATTTRQGGSDTRCRVNASEDLAPCTIGELQPRSSTSKSRKQGVQKPTCRFYISSSCKYGDHCKFYHPKLPSKLCPVNKPEECSNEKKCVPDAGVPKHTPTDLNLGMFMKPVKARAPVARPEPVKCKTPANLLQVELEQLAARFPGDQSKIIEKGKHGVLYRIVFTPTDPDWIFPFKTVDLLVDIPKEYPLKPLSVVIPDDQAVPKECISSINSAIIEWLTTRASGALMLRPFLQWLDRVITVLVQDSLPEGDDTTVTQMAPLEGAETSKNTAMTEDVQLCSGDEENENNQLQILAPKRGTEVRLKDLILGQYVGTVLVPNVKLVVECTRCKISQDMIVTTENCVSKSCLRCHACMSATFHPSLIHAGSITMGYMDLLGCVAVDVVMMDSNVTITCLECGRENTTRGFSYGQPKDVWCRRCHSKLTVYAEQCKFVQHQPRGISNQALHEVPKQLKLRQNEPVLKQGTHLPEYGTCQHYKKSHRWLRFPCCGKAYPCDICHDTKEDHPMERANRMICGYCSHEQVYTTSKPCMLCGYDLAVVKHSAFWEGGQGCRNKVKMSRNDKHKYSQSNKKTASKHHERVGLQGKKSPNN